MNDLEQKSYEHNIKIIESKAIELLNDALKKFPDITNEQVLIVWFEVKELYFHHKCMAIGNKEFMCQFLSIPDDIFLIMADSGKPYLKSYVECEIQRRCNKDFKFL